MYKAKIALTVSLDWGGIIVRCMANISCRLLTQTMRTLLAFDWLDSVCGMQ